MPNEYANFADIFSSILAAELLEHGINNHAIKLVDNWQPPYNLIENLGPVELERLKAYIENNLANSFIRISKSFIGVPILFHKKPDSSLGLYIDYQAFNYLTIKN